MFLANFGQIPSPSPLFNGDLLINVTSDQKSQTAVFPRIILGRVSYPWMVSKTIFDYPPLLLARSRALGSKSKKLGSARKSSRAAPSRIFQFRPIFGGLSSKTSKYFDEKKLGSARLEKARLKKAREPRRAEFSIHIRPPPQNLWCYENPYFFFAILDRKTKSWQITGVNPCFAH